MKGIYSIAALVLTANAIVRNKDEGATFRPPTPIVVAPWHNYDPNNVTNEEW
jgi:hypothetical protein